MLGIVFIGIPMNTNAQKTKAITKVIRTITKKGPKPKTLKPKTPKPQTPKSVRPMTYTCTICNGSGKVKSWNSYFGHYITSDCSNCHGKGKITKYVRL